MGLAILFFPKELSTQMGLGSQAEPQSGKTRMQETEGIGSKSLSFVSEKLSPDKRKASQHGGPDWWHRVPRWRPSSHGSPPPRRTSGTRPGKGALEGGRPRHQARRPLKKWLISWKPFAWSWSIKPRKREQDRVP